MLSARWKRHTRWATCRAICAAVLLLALLPWACSTPTSGRLEPRSPHHAPAAAADAPLADLRSESLRLQDRLVEARRIVDRSAAAEDCRRPSLAVGEAENTAMNSARAWLSAWCHLHRREWSRAADAGSRAEDHFASTGEIRRQIEMALLRALASRHLAPHHLEAHRHDPLPKQHTHRAVELFQNARIRLHGPADDPFAGDLPFLFAYAREAGLVAGHPRALSEPRGKFADESGDKREQTDEGDRDSRRVASTTMLLETARWQYRLNELRESLPHLELIAARHHLQQGRFDTSITRLHRALKGARESNDEVALRRGIGHFSRLARRLGHREAAEAAASWAPEGQQTEDDAEVAALPSKWLRTLDGARLRRVLDDRRASRRLTLSLADLLAERPVRPPTTLVDGLAGLDDTDFQRLSGLNTGRAWRFFHLGGRLLATQERPDSARRYLTRAVERIEIARAAIDAPELRQRFFRDKRPVYRTLVDQLVGLDTSNRSQSDYTRALRVANGVKARGLLDLLDGRIAPAQTVEPPTFDWTPAPNVLRAADQTLTELEKWLPEQTDDGSPRPRQAVAPSVDLPGELVDRLDRRTAVLEYLVGPRRSYVWVITDEGMRMRRLAGRRTLQPLVERFMATLMEPTPTAEQRREHRRLAERLYVELIGPFDDLVVDRRRLVVAADNLLYDLPFEALARPTPERERQGPDYLLRRHVLAYTPSSAAMLRLASRTPTHSAGSPDTSSPSRALLMGAPRLDRPAIDLLSLTDRLPRAGMFQLDEMYPELPGTERELASVTRRLDAASGMRTDTRTGAQATEHFLRNRPLDDYAIIHLATHGLSDAAAMAGGPAAGQAGRRHLRFQQPALLLTQTDHAPEDGVLTLGEILTWQTRARMVVLSGCTTGRGWRTLGDGAYGLAGAFLYTGARNVVASTWEVSDRDTTELMDHLYRASARGEAPAAALNAGQRAVMTDREGNVRPPFFWAGFRAIGGASML